MFWVTMIKIIHTYKTRAFTAENSIIIYAQVRVLVYILGIFGMAFTLFEWRLEIEHDNRSGNLATKGLEWTYCKIKISLQLPDADPAVCPGDINPARINYAHTAFESFLLSGAGLLVFIAACSDISVFHHWGKIFKLIWWNQRENLHDLVCFGKDPFVPGTLILATSTPPGSAEHSPVQSHLKSSPSREFRGIQMCLM